MIFTFVKPCTRAIEQNKIALQSIQSKQGSMHTGVFIVKFTEFPRQSRSSQFDGFQNALNDRHRKERAKLSVNQYGDPPLIERNGMIGGIVGF
jgi:hypothetical protein